MAETVVLDPTAVATGRVEFDITKLVAEAGPDWGDAQIEQARAEAERGQVPVGRLKLPIRTIQIPLLLRDVEGVTFAQARRRVQAKVGLFQQERGWISRETSEGTLYADIISASLKLGGSTAQALWDVDADAVLTLECIPDFYGAEETLTQQSELTLPNFAKVLQQGGVDAIIKGDYPGRCRIVVDELDADDQLGLIGGFRSRHYDSASTAALGYEAEALDPLDTAAIATVTGASGGASNNVVAHTNLATSWTPVLSTNLLAGTYLTHTGTYRLFARVRSPDGSAVQIRFVYDVGDLTLPEENALWTFPAASQFFVADLGEVRLDEVPVGAHRWQGQIQAKGTVGGEDVQIDRLMFQPLDEAAWRVAIGDALPTGLTDILARDEFTGTTAGNALNARTPTTGAAWATSGAATDFTFSDGPASGDETVTRATTSDASRRYAVFGSNVAAIQFQGDVYVSAESLQAESGVLIRYVDGSNHVRVNLRRNDAAADRWFFEIQVIVGGSTVYTRRSEPTGIATGTWYRIRTSAFTSGRILAQLLTTGDAVLATIADSDSRLVTGGTLDDGRYGFVDYNPAATASTRYYDNPIATTPVRDAVLMASQSAELRWDGMFREDSAGAAYGPLVPLGDLVRIPVSGEEERPVELFLKGSAGDFDQLPDSGIDDIRAQVFYRPSWVTVL